MVEQNIELDISLAKNGELSDEEITALVKLINDVYKVAEEGMWKENMKRTTIDEIKNFIAEGRLMVGRFEGKVVGSLVVEKFEAGSKGKFGMLVLDPNLRGKKLGSALIKAAEDWARNEGFKTMNLELLTPKDWEHPAKIFLHNWYTRIGYVQ